jgi:YgiT-type zinc finger domain-containing protein
MNRKGNSTAPPCPECQGGIMHLRYITYFTWLADELITVPNFPAWVCDVCGRREYDQQTINWLNMLLNPNAGRPTTRSQRRQKTPPTTNLPSAQENGPVGTP